MSGAWHNGKSWYKVTDILNKKGYETEALTLPGNGENESKDVTYEDYVNYVCADDKPALEAIIRAGDIVDAVFVGDTNLIAKKCEI